MKLTKCNIISTNLLLEFERLGCPDIDIPYINSEICYMGVHGKHCDIPVDTSTILCNGNALEATNTDSTLYILRANTFCTINRRYYSISEDVAHGYIGRYKQTHDVMSHDAYTNTPQFKLNEFIQDDVAKILAVECINGRKSQYARGEYIKAKIKTERNKVITTVKALF